jgi:hypothetical protein
VPNKQSSLVMMMFRRANQIVVKSANVLFSNASKDRVVSIPVLERNNYFECNFHARESKHFRLEISSPGLMGLYNFFSFVRLSPGRVEG